MGDPSFPKLQNSANQGTFLIELEDAPFSEHNYKKRQPYEMHPKC